MSMKEKVFLTDHRFAKLTRFKNIIKRTIKFTLFKKI